MNPAKRAHLEALRRHVERLARRTQRLDQVSRRYAWARLGLVLLGAILSFFAFQAGGPAPGWSIVGGFSVLFFVTAHFHRRVDAGIRRLQIWHRIKTTHIARMTLDWPRIPYRAAFSPEADHPFERDLDLAGPRSLHHLLDTAVSRGGSERLRAWLREPLLETGALHTRQARIRELTARPGFRDRLALYGILALQDPETPWDGEHLHAWLEQHAPHHSLRPLLLLLSALAALSAILFVLYWLVPMPALWTVSLTVYVGIYLFTYRRISGLFDEAFHLEKALKGFRAVAVFLETYRYRPGEHLAACCAPFRDATRRPSQLLKRVSRIATAASSQKSELLLVVLNLLGPWDFFFAYRLDRLKENLRDLVPTWLAAWYDLEALCALATFADLNPGYSFPTVLPRASRPDMIFQVAAIGHPLLDDARKVHNDFVIDRLGAVTIVTGSNMSGKSTFLRTLGINLCLAYAGGPVNAVRFRTLPFRLFTSIIGIDSVNDGLSHFYAEVRRLKRLLDALDAEPTPLFFLIDEIFRGTNNRERLLGSRAYVRAMVGQHATGLLSTHDLELTRLAEEMDRVHNAHFREEVTQGRLVFDYRLRPGLCPTTNALKIMELEGLPVEPSTLPAVD